MTRAQSTESELLAAVRKAARQEQFLEVVSAEDARRRFENNLNLSPLPGERVSLAASLGRVLANDVIAPIDVPPAEHMLMVKNDDRPGVIGTVGTMLGNAGVNIADMDVGRASVPGTAVMLIAPTAMVEADVLAGLQIGRAHV